MWVGSPTKSPAKSPLKVKRRLEVVTESEGSGGSGRLGQLGVGGASWERSNNGYSPSKALRGSEGEGEWGGGRGGGGSGGGRIDSLATRVSLALVQGDGGGGGHLLSQQQQQQQVCNGKRYTFIRTYICLHTEMCERVRRMCKCIEYISRSSSNTSTSLYMLNISIHAAAAAAATAGM